MTETNFQDNRLKDISFILHDLLKVIKVVSLYPETNPLPQSMKRSFAEKLVSLIEQYGQITITVGKDTFSYENEVVFQSRSKEENFAGVFFESGITDFSFKEGLDVDDVYKLLDAIKDYVNSSQKSQDLVSQIWEKQISGFSFSTLEEAALTEYNEGFNLDRYSSSKPPDTGNKGQFATDEMASYHAIFDLKQEANVVNLDVSSEMAQTQGRTLPQKPSARPLFYSAQPGEPAGTVFDGKGVDSISLRTAEAAGAMGFNDISPAKVPLPDTTLILNEEFKLSQEEEEGVAKLLCEDAEFDLYEATPELLKEMLFQEAEMSGFYETVTICEKIITEIVQAGKLEKGSSLLRYLKDLETKIRNEKPLWSERLKETTVTAGSRDRLNALAIGLNDHPEVRPEELALYLSNFGWEALSGITDLLGECHHQHHREALGDYLAQKGRSHTDVVAKGIYDKRWNVVCNSIGILSRIGDDASLNHLKHVLKHEERRVRLELVKSLKNNSNEKALELLLQTAMDPDREVRNESIDALVARRSAEAFEAIAKLINDEGFVLLEHEEQTKLLNAFSVLGQDAAVSFLARLILKFNPFRNSTLTFYRRAAFDALCCNRSEKGERLLVRLSANWRPEIRRQASAALRRRREFIYGGN